MRLVLNQKEKVQGMVLAAVPHVPRYLEQFMGVSFLKCDLPVLAVYLKAYRKR